AAGAGPWPMSDSNPPAESCTARATGGSALWENARLPDVVRVLREASGDLRVLVPVLGRAGGRHHARGGQNAAPGAFHIAPGGAAHGAVPAAAAVLCAVGTVRQHTLPGGPA